jgi:hypothetical protein
MSEAITSSSQPTKLSISAVGISLGLLFSVSYSACVVWDLVFPNQAMHEVWGKLLPWFNWLSWADFFIGLGGAFFYGLWIAIIFVPLYNFLSNR